MSFLDKARPTSTSTSPSFLNKARPVAKPAEEPSLTQGLVQGIAKPFLGMASQGRDVVNSVKDLGTGIKQAVKGEAIAVPQRPNQTTYDYGYAGKVPSFGKATLDKEGGKALLAGVGAGLGAASNLPIGLGVGTIGKQVVGSTLKKVLATNVPKLAAEGAAAGGMYGLGSSMQDGLPLKETALNAVENAVAGGVLGPVIGKGAEYAMKGVKSVVGRNLPENLTSKLDNHIRDIFKGTTGDIAKIDESALKAKQGLELLSKEARTIEIPDEKAALGSKATKPFNLQKSTPNELLSGVLEMDKKIAANGREAATAAKSQGVTLDTTAAEQKVVDAINNGEVPKATGERMLTQLQNLKNDPLAIHDWIQSINEKYGKKYQRGTIDDTMTGKLADDTAGVLRDLLDTAVDRKGYAQAFGNNQELKRMLVAIAKKANKGVNFGDITSEAGLDFGISVLTGNPAYMARTVGTGIFKGLVSKLRNSAGFRSFKKAAKITDKLPTEMKLPSTGVKIKPEPKPLQLPAPKDRVIYSPDPKQFNPDGSMKAPVIKVTDAKKNPLSTNPKTGKFQSSYSSQSTSKSDPLTTSQRTKSPADTTLGKITVTKPSATKTTQKLVASSIPKTLPEKGAKVQLTKKKDLISSEIPKTNEDFTKKYLAGTLSEEDKKAWKGLNSKQKDEVITIYRGQNSPVFDLKTPASVHNMKGKSFTIHKDQAEMYTLSGTGLKGTKAEPTIIEGTIPKSKVLTMSDLEKNPKATALLKDVKNQISKMTEDDLAEGSLPENVMDLLVPTARILGKDAVDMKSFGMVDEIRILNDATSFKQKTKTLKPTLPKSIPGLKNNYGMVAGFGTDGDGNPTFDPKMAALGMFGGHLAPKLNKKNLSKITSKTKKVFPKPLTGYHISREEEDLQNILGDGFNLDHYGKGSAAGSLGDPRGIYFFPSKTAYKNLEGWSDFPKEHIVKADLNVKNPYTVTSGKQYMRDVVKPLFDFDGTFEEFKDAAANEQLGGTFEEVSDAVTNFLKKKGHDAVIDKGGLLSYDEPQIIVFDTKKIKNITQNFAAAMGIPMMTALPKNQSTEHKIEGRKAAFSEDDLKELGAVLYGEIGNRPGDRQEFESQVIANVILNRMESNNPTYKGRSASQLLSAKNEFQAYGGKRYRDFKAGTATETEKVALINKFLDNLRAGKLPNKIDKALFYGHAKDNTIRVFNTWKEYQKNLHIIK